MSIIKVEKWNFTKIMTTLLKRMRQKMFWQWWLCAVSKSKYFKCQLNTSCGSTSSTFSIFFLESFSACRERLQVIMEGQNQTHYILSERLLSDTSSRHFNVLQWGFLHTNYYDPLLWQLIFWSIFLKEYTGNHIPELCKSINRLLASNRSL